jgi:hypothetical protein
MPRKKNNHTRQPGAQKPQPGPLPTGPYQLERNKKKKEKKTLEIKIGTKRFSRNRPLTVLKR